MRSEGDSLIQGSCNRWGDGVWLGLMEGNPDGEVWAAEPDLRRLRYLVEVGFHVTQPSNRGGVSLFPSLLLAAKEVLGTPALTCRADFCHEGWLSQW